jgi:DNA polymerase-3 subunit gamma/tau
MSYLVLARKYRPKTFDEVVGQEHVSRTLKNAIQMGRIAHAYLFSGPRGVGKTTVARILAKALNCDSGPTPDPCNGCQVCIGINEGSITDVHEIDGASNTGVDDVRELRENVKYLPALGRYKIYIIDEVHMLSINAFNALLKILEEPPAHVIFIFATTEPHKIPVTILSRTQRFDFKRISPPEIEQNLKMIAEAEGISVSDVVLAVIARESEGSMRDAQSLFDQVIGYARDTITEESVRELLGLTSRELVFQMAEAIITRDAKKAIELVDEVYRQGYDIVQYYRDLIDLMRHILVANVAPELQASERAADESERIDRLSRMVNTDELTLMFQNLFSAEPQLKASGNPKTALELVLIKMTRVGSVTPIDEIFQKLSRLEGGESGSGTEGESNLSFEFSSVKKNDNLPSPKAETEASPPHETATLDEFLSYLSEKSPRIHSKIETRTSILLDKDRLTIEFPKDLLNLELLTEEGNSAKLKKEASAYFKRDIDVVIKGVEKENTPPSPKGKGEGKRVTAETGDDLLNAKTTKNIIEVFDGVTVKGYTPPKKGN